MKDHHRCHVHHKSLVFSEEYGKQWVCPECVKEEPVLETTLPDFVRQDLMALQDKMAAEDY